MPILYDYEVRKLIRRHVIQTQQLKMKQRKEIRNALCALQSSCQDKPPASWQYMQDDLEESVSKVFAFYHSIEKEGLQKIHTEQLQAAQSKALEAKRQQPAA
jgi:hypothetical protein